MVHWGRHNGKGGPLCLLIFDFFGFFILFYFLIHYEMLIVQEGCRVQSAKQVLFLYISIWNFVHFFIFIIIYFQFPVPTPVYSLYQFLTAKHPSYGRLSDSL